ncbi:hypothetical protein RCIP0023_00314 [Klebsiella phage RCIP0023]|nr:hypothetical protein CPT_Muenster_088 [Klebsiella phage Muenster]
MKILTKEEVQKRLIVQQDYTTMHRFLELRLLNFIGTNYQKSCVNFYIKMLRSEIKLKLK